MPENHKSCTVFVGNLTMNLSKLWGKIRIECFPLTIIFLLDFIFAVICVTTGFMDDVLEYYKARQNLSMNIYVQIVKEILHPL